MCGIAGVTTRDGSVPDPALLDRMEAALAHRGPDGVRRLSRGDTALLHLRLAIVDLATGDQPLLAPGGSALVANGEIYNDPDLRRRMTGVAFATLSDCEPAVHLYEADGPAYAAALRGMYAIAIHDVSRSRLVLSRDPFGIKPLYYAQNENVFAFASEPAALLAAGIVARGDVAPRRCAELLQLKFTTGSETIFPGVHRVLPGETLVVERGEIVARHRLPALPEGAPVSTGGDARKKLDAVLLDSVTAHLRSDVPYGLFLSGGVDSAALLALMHRAGAGRVRALTVGWDGVGPSDESFEAERLARAMGADCHRLSMTERDFWTLAPRIAAAIDDPTADAAVLPTYMLGQAAAAGGLKVTLCGEGADELFGGYARYRKRRAPWRWIARPPRSGGLFDGRIGPGVLAGWRDGIAAAEALSATGGRTAMQATQAADVMEWLPNDLLTKLDRCLMAHGVEGRTPFLDPVVAGFAFRLPDRQRASLSKGKIALRDWLAEAFPQAGAHARKKGFKPPVGAWMAARAETLAPLVAAEPGIASVMAPEAVTACIREAAEQPQRAWSLLFYALWHARHAIGLEASGDIGAVLAEAGRCA